MGDRGLEERQDETRVDDRPESLVQHLKKYSKVVVRSSCI